MLCERCGAEGTNSALGSERTVFGSGMFQSAPSVEVQKDVNQLVGPLHERRLAEHRREVPRASGGRRESDQYVRASTSLDLPRWAMARSACAAEALSTGHLPGARWTIARSACAHAARSTGHQGVSTERRRVQRRSGIGRRIHRDRRAIDVSADRQRHWPEARQEKRRKYHRRTLPERRAA